MSLGPDDSRPPYLQVAEQLKRRIMAGEFAPGEKLPTGQELAEQYGVAPNTVLSAIRALRDEGIVSSQQGRGTFVRAVPEQESSKPASPEFELVMQHLDQFQKELRAMDDRLHQLERLVERLTGGDAPPAR
jgi:DNA-binding GntR family transcriptional regulator